jgi:cytochrome c
MGYRHASIGPGKLALQKLGASGGFDVDTTEQAALITDESLRKYRAVVFLSTTGDVLDLAQQSALMRFVQAGGGFVGIHAAADTEYEWYWYGKLVGAYFQSHPQNQTALVRRGEGPELAPGSPDTLSRLDEWYNYKKISPGLKVLYTLDESSYQGGENGEFHPISWYHEFDGGRSFYTGMGHTEESYSEPFFIDQLLAGIRYAIGERIPDYSKSRAVAPPEGNRFTKNVLGYYFDEPTEMTILPDGRIIFLERKGNVKLYDPAADTITVINTFNVYSKHEDGMIGLTRDPGFAQNNWLYIFYSHPSRSANVLSRFTFTNGRIDMSSEKELLEVVTQRETCCHTGGSLQFDPQGNLFISTGDNTNPFESDSYSPADERPGRGPFDAQKSSSNPNDLRGKILRIHPEPDGTYTIPEGNLFARGEPGTRPEVYVMGCRNPYRISFDERTGFLYWGEVGPDAGNDSPERGPRGYDEVNQARKPGFFGWPLFVGGNYAYADYNFKTKAIGPRHDPVRPLNDSPNNTGKQELPPVSAPFIWYPYAESPDFPLMKQGGRNAMAGPVYYSDKYAGKPGAFPSYLDEKLIIYDWMRNWVRLVTMDGEGNIMDIEPFLDHLSFNNTIDMAFGPDGKLYTLEYGTAWFSKNLDARLSRIDFNPGNRPPLAALSASAASGSVPLTVRLDASGSTDPDGDALTFSIDIKGMPQQNNTGQFDITLTDPGLHRLEVTVTDPSGASSVDEVKIVAGNETPVIDLTLSGNTMFFFPGGSAQYAVTLQDKEDGSLESGKIPGTDVWVSLDYMEQGFDKAQVAQGHQKPALPGKALIAESDCKSCHFIDKKSAGPAYRDVANRYKSDNRAVEHLSDKILKGGSGNWGEVAMAAHPQITREQAVQMVQYILSLSDERTPKSLPVSGRVSFDKDKGAYLVTASYDDKGNGLAPSLTAQKTVALRSPNLTAADVTQFNDCQRTDAQGFILVTGINDGSSVVFGGVDLTGVRSVTAAIARQANSPLNSYADVYVDRAEGEPAARIRFSGSGVEAWPDSGYFAIVSTAGLPVQNGVHDLILVLRNPDAGDESLFIMSQVTLGN